MRPGSFQFSWRRVIAWAVCVVSLAGCITDAERVLSPQDTSQKVLLVGRVVAVLTGERARRFELAVREIELIHQPSGTRYRITVEGSDALFGVFLPPGHYELIRVQINEGPFLSIAQLATTFSIEEGRVTFAGTWRFEVDSPRYGRMMLLSMVLEDEAQRQAEHKMQEEYPSLASIPVETVLPIPAETQTRLYEVAPYPRISRYFRRHNW